MEVKKISHNDFRFENKTELNNPTRREQIEREVL